ncbi:hypothetical protein EKE94_05110 [Mesobaculum littorinae]|uniref:Uncharacterized protein n=1 Tax=Mesobaculum littorinae TaxID=2486419 RepID=A0A438AHW2_9RHOB|nr:hypothetical protein [Mesobaculum littorinae]RVV98311.1 hypothetical protein EKE94_05110 [Mesobaculum littorinae]
MPDLQDVLNRVENTERKYDTNWVRPLSNAYVMAHARVRDVLDDQRKFDALVADLLITAVSMGMGAGLGALFAKTTLKSVAADAAVNYVIRRNMVRTFNAIAAVDENKALSFLISRGWDEAERRLSAQAKTAVGNLAAPRPGLQAALTDPQIFQNRLATYVDEALIAISSVAMDLNESDLPAETKERLAQAMLDSAVIRNAPVTPVFPDERVGAQRLELGIYMTLIMDSDRFVEGTGFLMGGAGAMRWDKGRPINVPTGHPDYPRAYSRHEISGSGAAQSASLEAGRIEYDQPGRKIESRIDDLHEAYYGRPFFSGRSDRDELVRAERVYQRLAGMTAPAF